MLKAGEDLDDTNEPDSRPPFVAPDHQETVNHLPQSSLLIAPPLALHEKNRTPSQVPSIIPKRRSTSRLLIQEVPSGYPSGYYVMPSVKGLITEGGHQPNERPPPSAKQDTTRTVQLLLDKWTKTGSSYVTTLIDEDPQGSEGEKAERTGRRSHRDKSGRQASGKTSGGDDTSDSDSESDHDSDSSSGYATIGDDSDVDNGRPRRSNNRPEDDYPQRQNTYREGSYERLPRAQPYGIPHYDDAGYAPYDPQPPPVHLPGAYAPYASHPWKYPGSAGNDEVRLLGAKLESQERYFNLQLEKLKVDLKLEKRDERDAVEAENRLRELEYRTAERAKAAAVTAAGRAAAEKRGAEEERYRSELIFEAWKPSLGHRLPGDEHEEYDILELLEKNDKGGIIWSRGNDARLSLFVGPRKFLTIQFLPPSHLQASEELDEYTIIGKEWVRMDVLELFEHPFVEKEATFYQVSRPLTFVSEVLDPVIPHPLH